MNGMPWHPAVVHLPIAFGMVAPLVGLWIALAVRRGTLARRAWAFVVALQVLAFLGGFAAMRTGENEEERVEKVVSEDLIEEHEERAELFMWLAGPAVVAGLGAWALPAGTLASAAAGGAVLLSAAAAGAVMSTGHLGGELVYKHGAASAYTSGQSAQAGGERHEGRDDDDD